MRQRWHEKCHDATLTSSNTQVLFTMCNQALVMPGRGCRSGHLTRIPARRCIVAPALHFQPAGGTCTTLLCVLLQRTSYNELHGSFPGPSHDTVECRAWVRSVRLTSWVIGEIPSGDSSGRLPCSPIPFGNGCLFVWYLHEAICITSGIHVVGVLSPVAFTFGMKDKKSSPGRLTCTRKTKQALYGPKALLGVLAVTVC